MKFERGVFVYAGRTVKPSPAGRRWPLGRMRVTSRQVSLGYLETSTPDRCLFVIPVPALCHVTLTCPTGILSRRERSFVASR